MVGEVMVWLWLGIFLGMILLACLVWVAWEAHVARDEFDAELARYDPRHARSVPRRGAPDPWPTILRDPEPAPAADTGTLERLTETGELRALTDAWIAKHIRRAP